MNCAEHALPDRRPPTVAAGGSGRTRTTRFPREIPGFFAPAATFSSASLRPSARVRSSSRDSGNAEKITLSTADNEAAPTRRKDSIGRLLIATCASCSASRSSVCAPTRAIARPMRCTPNRCPHRRQSQAFGAALRDQARPTIRLCKIPGKFFPKNFDSWPYERPNPIATKNSSGRFARAAREFNDLRKRHREVARAE